MGYFIKLHPLFTGSCIVNMPKKIVTLSYLPTPPIGQDMTQGQFLSGV